MLRNELTYFILEVNAAIDTGRYDDISIADVILHIEDRKVLPWLTSKLAEDVDLSPFDGRAGNELHDRLLEIYEDHRGQESRKWGVKNRGLCLLVAWAAELIQRSKWE